MMKTSLMMAVATVALLAGCSKSDDATGNVAASGPTVAAPAGTEWSATVSQTPEGGFRMGNPDAKVKLIEYGAFSCSHCAEFAEKSKDGLKALVNKGNVSYEFRNFLLNIIDVPAAIAVRCGGPQPFFQISEQLFAAQRDWLGKTSTITPAEQAAFSKMTPVQTSAALAGKLELDKFVQQRGVPSEKVKACLADSAAIDVLGKNSEDGRKQFQITGTPTFIINGQTVRDANTWEKIEPMLKAAGA